MNLNIFDILNPVNSSGRRADPLLTEVVEDKDNLSYFDPYNKSVEVDLSAGDFISGETVLLMSGPPTLDMALNILIGTKTRVGNPNALKTIGLTVNANIQDSKQYSTWDEQGFSGYRAVPNKTSTNLTLQRVRSNHNSLMYACYRWLIAAMQTNQSGGVEQINHMLFGSPSSLVFQSYPGFVATINNGKTVLADRHYDNLMSEFFLFPFGVLSLELDHYMNIVTAFYFENCKAVTLSRTISESPLIVEGVQIQATKKLPALGLNFPGIQKKIFEIKDTIEEGFKSIKP